MRTSSRRILNRQTFRRRLATILAVAGLGSSLSILTFAPPASPQPGTCSFNNANVIVVHGDLLYITTRPGQVALVDPTKPGLPQIIVAGTGSTSFAGDGGPAKQAGIQSIFGMAVDTFGNLFLVNSSRVRKVSPGTDGVVNGGPGEIITTVVGIGSSGFEGDGGPATSARIRFAKGIDFGSTGELYLADTFNNRIRMVVPGADLEVTGAADEIISTVAGTGTAPGTVNEGQPATSTDINLPVHVLVVPSLTGDDLFLTEASRLRKVTAGADGRVNGSADDLITTQGSGLGSTQGFDRDGDGNFFVVSSGSGLSNVKKVDPLGVVTLVAGQEGLGTSGFGGDDGPATAAMLSSPQNVALDGAGVMLIADLENLRIRKVVPGATPGFTGDTDEIITTYLGNGTSTSTCPPLHYDLDGDLRDDIAIFRPSIGAWFVQHGLTTVWGGVEGDIPVPGDYDGNGTTDVAVYRPSIGAWFVQNGLTTVWGGVEGDIPVPGDYDGNGTTDIAIFRPSIGAWFVQNGLTTVWGGVEGDIPVPGDYDGNGTTDIAIFRPSIGAWFVQNGLTTVWGGVEGDIPVPGDYDGNGTTDIAIFRPSIGAWFVQHGLTTVWGNSTDIPLSSPAAVYNEYFGP